MGKYKSVAFCLVAFCMSLASLACRATVQNSMFLPTETPPVEIIGVVALSSTPNPKNATVTAYSFLNVREGPGIQYPPVAFLKNGQKVVMTGACENGWSEVAISGTLGWVNSRYISGGCDEK